MNSRAVLIIRNRGGISAEVLCVSGAGIKDDLADMGCDPSDMHLPDTDNLERGLWLFEGDREPAEPGEDDEWSYTGNYRRPAYEELQSLMTLDGWDC